MQNLRVKVQQQGQQLEELETLRAENADLRRQNAELNLQIGTLSHSESELLDTNSRLRESLERVREDLRSARTQMERTQQEAERLVEERRVEWLEEKQTAGKRSRTMREIQPGQRAPGEGSICTEKEGNHDRTERKQTPRQDSSPGSQDRRT